ncbi:MULTISPECIES: alpha/beta hydrolase [Pseudoalteromonas]|uniref:Alpha/beta fold hydrolase n=1 Tax=Pseudoalteromonas rubra TaxID=43658 RepID=A0A5S3V2V6_9GAMM|nr:MULTISPECIES: alpha/beta hydrolase [Pseudoalteromonas]MCG7561982.1 alpha/beta hydrolase [Pseudoalteromonas sp. McH1-42]QPB81936.1 alpha/beta fold hydrolase [Pseudoalteromonas rubra]
MNSKVWLPLSCAVILSGCNSTSQQAPVQSLTQETDAHKKSVIFIHGAHSKGTAWSTVQSQLTKKGISNYVVDLPGRKTTIDPKSITLDHAAQSLCTHLRSYPQPLALVAHSQGGAVVHKAITLCNDVNISDIVYVSAVAPIEGAKPFALLSKQDEDHYFSGITYEDGWMKISDTSAYLSSFTETHSKSQQQFVLDNSVDEPAITGDGKVMLSKATLAPINKAYVFAIQDKIISLSSQKKIAESIGITQTYSLDSGHLPMLTKPFELAEVITQALQL